MKRPPQAAVQCRRTRLSILQILILWFVILPPAVRADQYCETVPPGAYRLVGCNLSIASISFPGNYLNKFDNGFTAYSFDPDDLLWTPHDPSPITRGDASVIWLASSNQVCFDDPTNAPVLPLSIGYTTRASCQSNIVAGFEDIVGRAPVNGTRVYKFLGGDPFVPGSSPIGYVSPNASPEWAVYSYTNGIWSPSVPIAAIGEGVVIYQPTAFVYQPTILNARIASGNFIFELETVYGRPVTIEFRETLPAVSWQELTSFTGDGHRRTVTDDGGVNGDTSRFYRIRTTP